MKAPEEEVNQKTTQLVTVPFHGDGLVTFEANGEPHVAMRRIVENLGMSWGGQREKLQAQAEKFSCADIRTAGADGKAYDMLAMPVKKLPLWLATINPNKIPDPVRRAKVELYQSESAVALHDYWTKGVAVRGDLDGVLTDIDPSARKVFGGIMKGIIHKELTEAVQSLLPALIAQAVTDQQYGVVRGLTAGDVIELAGVKDRKGLKSIPRRVSDRLRQFHAEAGAVVNRATLGCSKAYIFDAATARRWLDEGGKAMIQQWIAEKRGQGVLRLVPRKTNAMLIDGPHGPQ